MNHPDGKREVLEEKSHDNALSGPFWSLINGEQQHSPNTTRNTTTQRRGQIAWWLLCGQEWIIKHSFTSSSTYALVQYKTGVWNNNGLEEAIQSTTASFQKHPTVAKGYRAYIINGQGSFCFKLPQAGHRSLHCISMETYARHPKTVLNNASWSTMARPYVGASTQGGDIPWYPVTQASHKICADGHESWP